MLTTNHSLPPSPTDLKDAARTALETLAARRFTDAEWRQLRSRLLEYATILRDWDRAAMRKRPASDKAVMLRQARTSTNVLDDAA